MADNVVRCRAKLVPECADGRTEEDYLQTSESGNTLKQDGTWDGATIVCDACYIAVMPFTPSGQALTDELPRAIEHYRTQAAYCARHSNPAALAAEARQAAVKARPGSPMQASAIALAAMADAEVARRGRQQ